jgi:ribosomal protein S18 acetylase RimI-like enzyme
MLFPRAIMGQAAFVLHVFALQSTLGQPRCGHRTHSSASRLHRLMSSVTIQPFENLHRDQVIALWEAVFGYETAHNDPSLAIDKKVAVQDGLLFVALADAALVVGTIMAGYDGHRGWIYSVAVHPSHRKQGIGRNLVAHAERALTVRGCVKINLQILETNEAVAAFYAGLGYSVEKRINMGKRIVENIPGA